MMHAYYLNVADERQPQDIRVVSSTVGSDEEPLAEGYDFRRALTSTICEKVLTKYNIDDAVITIDFSGGMHIKLLPLSHDSSCHEEEGTRNEDDCY